MDAQTLLATIHELSDLELATLLSLVANNHCLLTVRSDLIDDLAAELALIASDRFGLSHVILDQTAYTSTDTFINAALEPRGTISLEDDLQPGSLRARLASLDIRAAPRDTPDLDNRALKHVVIAKHFNLADEDVQVQAIEVITNRRALTRTTVHSIPKTFLFLPIVAELGLSKHLNDWVFMSHHHEAEDGFVNLEDGAGEEEQGREWVSREVIEQVRGMGRDAAMTAEVRRYLQDIVTFLRLSRGVDGGISPRATSHFVDMSKYLAPLHGLTFVTPALVGLAARKIYRHRITVASPGRERSLQYGSDPVAVTEALEGLTADEIIEEVLATVPCPK